MYYFLTTIFATSSLATTFTTTTNYALLQLHVTTFTPEITTYSNTSTRTYILILL